MTDNATEDFIADEIEKFLMSAVYSTEHRRMLTTVAVAQIDAPNARTAKSDAQQASRLIEDSLAIVNSELITFRGRRFRTPNAYFSATFDGPARAIRFACSCAKS